MDVKSYDDHLPLFESEINQTIFSGNTHITKNLFEELKERKEYFLSITKNDILYWISEWNQEWYKEYEKKIDEQTEKYFANEKFKGLKHLDRYKDFRFVGPGFQMFGGKTRPDDWEEVELTYHAFYCIDDIGQKWAKHIDGNLIGPYLDFLGIQLKKFLTLIDKYIRRYDAGEFTPEKKDETTWVDKQIKKFKNNKITGSIFIFFIILSAIYGLFKFGCDIYNLSEDKKPQSQEVISFQKESVMDNSKVALPTKTPVNPSIDSPNIKDIKIR